MKKIKISSTSGTGKTSTLLLLAESLTRTHRVAFVSDELTPECISEKIKFLGLDIKSNFYVITTTEHAPEGMGVALLDVHDTVLSTELLSKYEQTGVQMAYYIEQQTRANQDE